MSDPASSRILLVDDHELIRVGLKRILLDAGVASTITETATAREALQLTARESWNLVVLDLSLPDNDGLEVLKQIKALAHPPPVLVLTILPEDQVALRVLRAGADGFLPKGSAAREFVRAVTIMLAGGKFVSPGVASQLIESLRTRSPAQLHEALSDREDQVFRGIVAGLTVSELATRMDLSVKTVSTYRANALRKLNLENNAQLLSYAHRHGLA